MICVAIIGASHWHVPDYVRALRAFGARFVAVSDEDVDVASRWSQELGSTLCRAYPSAQALLSTERPDLIFAFAPHARMTDLAALLVESGVPFVMEKPMGIQWRALEAVAQRAEKKGIWAGVDLVVRTLALAQCLIQLRNQDELGHIHAYVYHLLSGSPQRYIQANVPWMLDPAQAGGGPLYNFGPHVIDLFLTLTGEPITGLNCWMSHHLYRLAIEDYALLSVWTPSGTLGSMAVGYICPMGLTEKRLRVSTDRLWVSSSSLAVGTIHWRDGRATHISGEPDGDDWAMTYVRETLRRFQSGEPPVATIAEMVPVLRAINEAQVLAESCTTATDAQRVI